MNKAELNEQCKYFYVTHSMVLSPDPLVPFLHLSLSRSASLCLCHSLSPLTPLSLSLSLFLFLTELGKGNLALTLLVDDLGVNPLLGCGVKKAALVLADPVHSPALYQNYF